MEIDKSYDIIVHGTDGALKGHSTLHLQLELRLN